MNKKRSLKILHLPINWAGAPLEISSALRRRGHRSFLLVLRSRHIHDNFKFKADVNLTTRKSVKNLLKILLITVYSLVYFDIFHFYSRAFVTLRTYPTRNKIEYYFEQLHLPFLRLLGKKIYFTFLGSDMRILGISKNRITDKPEEYLRSFDKEFKLKALQVIDRYVDGIFFHPELHLEKFVSKPHYFTVYIDLKKFEYIGVSNNLSCPIIIHAPTNPTTKGTEYVEKAIQELKDKKYNFEFKLIQKMKQEDFINEVKAADIVLDQFIVGSYGKLAVEAMSMGKPVVGYIKDFLFDIYPDLPIISTDENTIAKTLQYYLDNPEKLKIISKKSREFVEKYHDSKILAQQLEDIYLMKK